MRRLLLSLGMWLLGAFLTYCLIRMYWGVSDHPSGTTAIEYVAMTEEQLGVPPRISLGECVEVPLYVNGEQKHGVLGGDIDNPTLLNQKFNPSGSVINRYEGRTRDGAPLPNVVWVVFGRNEIRDDDSTRVRSGVQMIGYNKQSGATAFFESAPGVDERWITHDESTFRMRGQLPWIDDPDGFNKSFFFFEGFQCTQCHQADPFISSPFLNGAKLAGTDEPVVPFLDSESPYYVINGEDWDMRTLHVAGNGCLDCHRIGHRTVELFDRMGYDINEFMPPDDPGSLSADYRKLREAWNKGPQHIEEAEWQVPRAGDTDAHVVGEDYPFKN